MQSSSDDMNLVHHGVCVVDLGTGLDIVDGILYVLRLTLWNKSVMRKRRVSLPLKRFRVCGAMRFVTDFTKIDHVTLSRAIRIRSICHILIISDAF